MAASTVTVTANIETPLVGKGVLVIGTLAISAAADTYATGGLALGAAEFRNKVALSVESKPRWLIAFGKSGYFYEYDVANGKLLVRAQTNAAAEDAPLGELTAAAMPAGVSGDTINFIALFDKFPNA